MQTYKTADDAVNDLVALGFTKTSYDPEFPYQNSWNDGDAMFARVVWDTNRGYYYLHGIHA